MTHELTGLGNVPVARWEDKHCQVHLFHSPRPEYVERHHVQPLAWGGADTAANVVHVCPTGHANIHYLLQQYQLHNGKPPRSVLRSFGKNERAMAQRGWDLKAK